MLGKDTGPELLRLKQLRDALKGRGYGASFIKELPEIPMMSNEEKVRMWSMASRFCVMIDDVPSGHIAEYQILKSQRSILALLRPRGRGSTFMIGDDPIVDTNHIAVFEFDHTPLAKVDEAIEWAEAIAKTREDGYGAAYPWRHTTPR